MASNGNSSSPKPNPKKANLMDPHSIKHLLDESVSEIVTGRGYTEDLRLSNIRLLVGTVIIAIALVAQFYRKKFPENKDFLIGCISLYIIFNGLLQLTINKKEKNAILFTYALPEGNTVVDALARNASEGCPDWIFNSRSLLPKEVKGLLVLDNTGFGTFRNP